MNNPVIYIDAMSSRVSGAWQARRDAIDRARQLRDDAAKLETRAAEIHKEADTALYKIVLTLKAIVNADEAEVRVQQNSTHTETTYTTTFARVRCRIRTKAHGTKFVWVQATHYRDHYAGNTSVIYESKGTSNEDVLARYVREGMEAAAAFARKHTAPTVLRDMRMDPNDVPDATTLISAEPDATTLISAEPGCEERHHYMKQRPQKWNPIWLITVGGVEITRIIPANPCGIHHDTMGALGVYTVYDSHEAATTHARESAAAARNAYIATLRRAK